VSTMSVFLIGMDVAILTITYFAILRPNWKTTTIKGRAGETVNFRLGKGEKAKVEEDGVVVKANTRESFVIYHEAGFESSRKFTNTDYQFSGILPGGIWTVNKDGVYFELYPSSDLIIQITRSRFQKISVSIASAMFIATLAFLEVLIITNTPIH
jgi:hypothetical protein